MPKLQNFPVTRNNDEQITVLVDSDMTSDTLAGATVEWSVYPMAYGVPDVTQQLIAKSSLGGGIVVLESPPMTFVIDMASGDTVALDLGNYYHEGLLVDNEGRRSTVIYGALALTLSVG